MLLEPVCAIVARAARIIGLREREAHLRRDNQGSFTLRQQQSLVAGRARVLAVQIDLCRRGSAQAIPVGDQPPKLDAALVGQHSHQLYQENARFRRRHVGMPKRHLLVMPDHGPFPDPVQRWHRIYLAPCLQAARLDLAAGCPRSSVPAPRAPSRPP